MGVFKIRILVHETHLDQDGTGIFMYHMDPAPVVCNIQMGMAYQSYVSAGTEIGVFIDMCLNVGKSSFHAFPGIKINQI